MAIHQAKGITRGVQDASLVRLCINQQWYHQKFHNCNTLRCLQRWIRTV